MNNKKDVICFVDGANVFFGANQSGIRINFKRLSLLLGRKDPIHRTVYFSGAHESPSFDQVRFTDFLKKGMGWDIQEYKLGRKTHTCHYCKSSQMVQCEKGVDAGILLKMMEVASSGTCKKIILLSGDADFCEVVQLVQARFGVSVQIVSWKSGLSAKLKECSTLPVVILDEIRHLITWRSIERDDLSA